VYVCIVCECVQNCGVHMHTHECSLSLLFSHSLSLSLASSLSLSAGQFVADLPHGFGCFAYHDGAVYEGMCEGGCPNGWGLMRESERDFLGGFRGGLPHGVGVLQYKDDSNYKQQSEFVGPRYVVTMRQGMPVRARALPSTSSICSSLPHPSLPQPPSSASGDIFPGNCSERSRARCHAAVDDTSNATRLGLGGWSVMVPSTKGLETYMSVEVSVRSGLECEGKGGWWEAARGGVVKAREVAAAARALVGLGEGRGSDIGMQR